VRAIHSVPSVSVEKPSTFAISSSSSLSMGMDLLRHLLAHAPLAPDRHPHRTLLAAALFPVGQSVGLARPAPLPLLQLHAVCCWPSFWRCGGSVIWLPLACTMANGIALIALIGATKAFFVLDGSDCWIFCVEHAIKLI
jgi:hypothetical protein